MSHKKRNLLKKGVVAGAEILYDGILAVASASLDVTGNILSQASDIIDIAFKQREVQSYALDKMKWDGKDITLNGRKFDSVTFKTSSKQDLEHIVREADSLAAEFRILFKEASTAWDDGNKALAKSLSVQGKEKQSRCDELNREANVIRERLNRIDELIRALNAKQGESFYSSVRTKQQVSRALDIDVEKQKNSLPKAGTQKKSINQEKVESKVSINQSKIVKEEKKPSSDPSHLLFNVEPTTDDTRLEWSYCIIEHSFDPHKLKDKNSGYREFPGYMRTKEEMRKTIEKILKKPHKTKKLENNRKAYYDKRLDAVVVINMNLPTQSTFFQPALYDEENNKWRFGEDYFDALR